MVLGMIDWIALRASLHPERQRMEALPDELEDRAKLWAIFFEKAQKIELLKHELREWEAKVGLMRYPSKDPLKDTG
jgi:DNA primase